MENIITILTAYYGLDWLALLFGVSGSYLISSQNRWGFLLACVGCVCGFFVASLSAQYGFVVYNLLLLLIMLRGYVNLSRFQAGHGAPAE
ncbi:MAG TPA: hypothetical protein VGD95_04880 [Micavibrio sp.]